MKKKIAIFFIVVLLVISCFSVVYAEENESNKSVLTEEGTSQLIEIKERELNSIEDYKKDYGSDAYGTAAYILNKVRLYSIPLVFVGIAISAIYQYVIGIRKLDIRDKGFSTMIAIITIGVICQILPLVFAIVVKTGVS